MVLLYATDGKQADIKNLINSKPLAFAQELRKTYVTHGAAEK
jgi:hypothetical protein